MELFKQQTGAFMVHIPYRGIAPAFTDLLGGQTQAMFPGLAAALPHIRSGRVRPLAVTGAARQPTAQGRADARRVGLQGLRRDAVVWRRSGPAGMPADVVKQLNDTLIAVLNGARPDARSCRSRRSSRCR